MGFTRVEEILRRFPEGFQDVPRRFRGFQEVKEFLGASKEGKIYGRFRGVF